MIQFKIMISLGFSPCPNDTFIFYALANGKIDLRDLDFSLIIDDVETLNQYAVERKLQVTKVSCHAFFSLKEDYQFLRSGGALGRGCGPLLVAKDRLLFSGKRPSKDLTFAIPGRLTTAFLLLRLYLSSEFGGSGIGNHRFRFSFMPFHMILDSVSKGSVDAGLIIHESRFTYPGYGLEQVVDLGEWWERETGLPIPLGGIVARKSLHQSTITTIEDLIRESVEYSSAHPDEAMSYIKQHAQEISEDVITQHIALYVNTYTFDLGEDGRAALDELMRRANSLKKYEESSTTSSS